MKLIDADKLQQEIEYRLKGCDSPMAMLAFSVVLELLDLAPEEKQAQLRWNRIESRPMDAEEKEYFHEHFDDYMVVPDEMLENCPDDGDEVMLADGSFDIFANDGDFCNWEDADEVEPGQKWIRVKDIVAFLDAGEGKTNEGD